MKNLMKTETAKENEKDKNKEKKNQSKTKRNRRQKRQQNRLMKEKRHNDVYGKHTQVKSRKHQRSNQALEKEYKNTNDKEHLLFRNEDSNQANIISHHDRGRPCSPWQPARLARKRTEDFINFIGARRYCSRNYFSFIKKFFTL